MRYLKKWSNGFKKRSFAIFVNAEVYEDEVQSILKAVLEEWIVPFKGVWFCLFDFHLGFHFFLWFDVSLDLGNRLLGFS